MLKFDLTTNFSVWRFLRQVFTKIGQNVDLMLKSRVQTALPVKTNTIPVLDLTRSRNIFQIDNTWRFFKEIDSRGFVVIPIRARTS